MGNDDTTINAIVLMDGEFQQLTAHQAFGYIAAPTPTSLRITFHDGTVFTRLSDAYHYMHQLLSIARTHPGNLPYPYDQPVP